MIRLWILLIFALFCLTACDSSPTASGASGEDPPEETSELNFTSVSPTSGEVTGGTSVTITGVGFISGIGVSFGANACTNVVINSSTELTCDTPAGATGNVAVTLSLPDDLSVTANDAFTYGQVAPTFGSASPNNYINTQSTTVTIAGTGFVDNGSGTSSVTIGGMACGTVAVNSASELTCNSPTGVAAGTADIVITNPDAQNVTSSAGFTYRTPPTFTELNGGGAEGIFLAVCSGCHGGSGGLTVSNYASVSSRVVAGSPTTSLIWQRINNIGNLMPQGGPMMSTTQIQYIEDWILDGAQNN